MFVMAYFRTEAEALHLAVSDDGWDWRPVHGGRPLPLGEDPPYRLRDPHLSRATDGRFHLFATGGWDEVAIAHAVSDDLLAWSTPEPVAVMAGVAGARNCWAPECVHDPVDGSYRLLWSATVNPDDGLDWRPGWWDRTHDHRIWTTTTRDFAAYASAALFFAPGYSVIDATLAEHAGRWLLAFKDERGENRPGTPFKAIRVCAAPSATGPFRAVSDPVTPPLTESPTLFRVDDRWLMFFDHFAGGAYGAAASEDGMHWADVTARVRFPPGVRHASVLEVDAGTGRALDPAV
jgi:beta-galactosidase